MADVDGTRNGSEWEAHCVTTSHNGLWKGDPALRWSNDTQTQAYTSLVPLSGNSAGIVYAHGWTLPDVATFMMRVDISKTDDLEDRSPDCPWSNSQGPCARLNTTRCILPGGGTTNCGVEHQQCRHNYSSTPRFHITSLCGMNDPNGVFYDKRHGVYHAFYQDHLALPRDGHGHGSIWGHVASRDLVRWVSLPVALWNDEAWDDSALFTGSATIVDGVPVIIYPGMTQTYPGGDNLARATPANLSDPLYVHWRKSPGPVANHTHCDPSSAWQTGYGERRFQTKDGQVYATGDPAFQTGFHAVPNYTISGSGECSSLFALPRFTPGSAAPDTNTVATVPTHVHKHSTYADPVYRIRVDEMRVGVLTEAPPGQPGTWTPLADFQEVDKYW